MDVQYRGESPAKKFMRVMYWAAVERQLGKLFRSGNFLVITSQYAGDVSTLLAMGVSPKNIYGVDIDKHAIAATKLKYPKIQVEQCPFWEATTAFPSLRNNLGCAFIDLCAPLRDATLDRLFEFGENVQLLGYEFMCGREKGELNQTVKDNSAVDTLAAIARLKVLQTTRRRNQYFRAYQNWHYNSHSAAHIGKPMIVSLGRLHHSKLVNANSTSANADWDIVREICLSNPAVAPLWNISKGTMAAWRAHETRGTYT